MGKGLALTQRDDGSAGGFETGSAGVSPHVLSYTDGFLPLLGISKLSKFSPSVPQAYLPVSAEGDVDDQILRAEELVDLAGGGGIGGRGRAESGGGGAGCGSSD